MAVSSILSSASSVIFSNDLATSKHRPVEPVAPMTSSVPLKPVTSSTEPTVLSKPEPVLVASSQKPLAEFALDKNVGSNRHYMPHFDGCNNCKIKIVFKQ